MYIVLFLSFFGFTGLVAFLTWLIVHKKETSSVDGYFLAGRSLTFPVIAGSLLLTNLSTEQMVGLNGSAFSEGFIVMTWEILAVVALVAMALAFLPKFLRSGVTTVPEYLALRMGKSTGVICNIIFLAAYTFGLLPIILYTGAVGLNSIFDMKELTGIANDQVLLWTMIWFVGIVGSIYALFGGLRSVAVSDTLNGIGLLIGGLMVVFFALYAVSDGAGIFAGLETIYHAMPEKFDSTGDAKSSVPFSTIFTGVLIINLFYWCTNQPIIQRTLAASSLAEGQKGVLLCGALKLLGPLYLVLPGVIACYMFSETGIKPDQAYGKLVHTVLPAPLTGFFAAVMTGAILSSFNSVLNAVCTLYSLGIYKQVIRRDATEQEIVKSGKVFGWIVVFLAMLAAPLLSATASIFTYLQHMNSLYFIPIFAVVLMAMFRKRVPAKAADIALIGGCLVMAAGLLQKTLNQYHYAGIVFAGLIVFMLIMEWVKPEERNIHENAPVDMTPWKYAKAAGAVLLAAVVTFYVLLAK